MELHFHIGEDLEEFLRAYAKNRGMTLSAAVRLILYEAKNQERKP